ncbi:MAG: efflux RND transporter periplasmic adaptor subunit, partial [Acidobacterium ailaaui]|nr:efflux RND transporter periplasmic adaptor subunit [Pseudacidobacterium ailaaui]
PLLTVMDTSALLAKLHISQLLAQQLKVGDPAVVTVPGMEETVPAKVSLVSPALDPGSTTIEIWVRAENKDGALKVGTPVHVAIQTKAVSNAVKVPISALLTAQDGSTSVMVMGPDGVAHKRQVQTGIRDEKEVQIMSGVTPADMVITEGAYSLDDGTRVKLASSGQEKPAAHQRGGDDD